MLASGVGAPERERGRFRSYLLGALKPFLSKPALAEKRGGGAEHIPLTTDPAAGLPLPAPVRADLPARAERLRTGRRFLTLSIRYGAKPAL